MNILVCIKQVPGTSKVEVDPETGALRRDGVESKLNPYDLYALETAFRLRDQVGGTVTAATMGPPQAEAALREAMAMGADAGFLLTDRRFAGSDVLATAWTLSQGIRRQGLPDLILCGRQTTDGDTAQVGPAVAELLGWPHAAWVSALAPLDGGRILATQDLGDRVQEAEIGLPCLITVEKGIHQPRLPSWKRIQALRGRTIVRLGLDELDDPDSTRYGAQGSPTRVERMFPPPANDARELWRGDADELAARCFAILEAKRFTVASGRTEIPSKEQSPCPV